MKPTKIAMRITSDGTHVSLWSDGSVLLPLGQHINGWGGKRLMGRAGWMFMGAVELYELSEIAALAKACLWAGKSNKTPGEMRAHLHRPTPIKFIWTVAGEDRNGKTTLRTCVLDRLRWPGLAVWNERGRYTLMTTSRGSAGGTTCFPTGFEFKSVRELSAHLREINAIQGSKARVRQ